MLDWSLTPLLFQKATLFLTMLHPWADLWQISHCGGGEVKKALTNGPG